MTRRAAMLPTVTILTVVSLPLRAQTPSRAYQTETSTTASHLVTVAGCLTKESTGGFVLDNAEVGRAATTDPAAPAAPTTTIPTTTTTTTDRSVTDSTAGTTWILSGTRALEKYVGQKIQVMGRTTWSDAAAVIDPPTIDIRTLKTLADSCS